MYNFYDKESKNETRAPIGACQRHHPLFYDSSTNQPTDKIWINNHDNNNQQTVIREVKNIKNEYASKQEEPMSLGRDGWSERGWNVKINCRMKLVFP